MVEKVLIHYGEIGLKGKNIKDFEKRLIYNIKRSFKLNNLKVQDIYLIEKRLICTFEDIEREKISNVLKKVFGIKNFSFIYEFEKSKENILIYGKKLLEKVKNDGIKLISFKTKRSNKNFEINSPEINNELRFIAEKELDLSVNYKEAKFKLYTEVLSKSIIMYFSKIQGLGGLPVGSTGNVLLLLSGGIDSPVAAFNMMKRGCSVNYIHIHNFFNNEIAKKSKIISTIEILNNYGLGAKLFLVPYNVFEFNPVEMKNKRYNLLFFKHYILKLAEKIAIENNFDAIVTGDNLAQVASQTIENLNVTSMEMELQILRPLLTYDKEEIIEKANKIGTFEESIKKYKDCCSLIAKNPITMGKKKVFKEILENNNLDLLIEKSIEKSESIIIKEI